MQPETAALPDLGHPSERRSTGGPGQSYRWNPYPHGLGGCELGRYAAAPGLGPGGISWQVCNLCPGAGQVSYMAPHGRRPEVTDDATRRFEMLYRQHFRAVLRYALARLEPESAKDVTAETFLIAWRLSLIHI